MASAHRSYKEECSFIERLDKSSFLIKKGFVPNMKEFKNVVMIFGRFVPWSFRSRYKKLFRSEPEICLIDSFFIQLRSEKKTPYLSLNGFGQAQWL